LGYYKLLSDINYLSESGIVGAAISGAVVLGGLLLSKDLIHDTTAFVAYTALWTKLLLDLNKSGLKLLDPPVFNFALFAETVYDLV